MFHVDYLLQWGLKNTSLNVRFFRLHFAGFPPYLGVFLQYCNRLLRCCILILPLLWLFQRRLVNKRLWAMALPVKISGLESIAIRVAGIELE